ncbi:unnamed protein product [Fraxinus pennsylvanica]|uniref:HMG box domain-containing protein n=1 Tax=Fraxinus pennsylvanica TaxID=56036 RepID=A0AAD1Z403_9LAMI|nr:unnamed protein product [Fraxinus pennsylvanica]
MQVDIDFNKKPIVVGKDGKDVYFKDIWPSTEEIAENQLSVPTAKLYSWDSNSTYIHEPPYFKNMTMDPLGPHGVEDANCLMNFGDSITTDHISPAGSIHKDSPAAKYLVEHGVDRKDFNSYGSCSLENGVKAVIAKSFERIHRSNLVGMGIVPLCFKSGEDADTLGLTGHELYTIDLPIRPGQDVTIQTDTKKSFTCTIRFDTEVTKAGGEKWKLMSDSEKAPYVAKAGKRKAEYDIALAAFNKTLVHVYGFCEFTSTDKWTGKYRLH